MKKAVFWIIAGTTEGRELIDRLRLSNAEIYVSVATDYGRELIQPDRNLHIQARRLSREEMTAFIREVKPDCVIDTTHPYARIVTDNLREACRDTLTDYVRLHREAGESARASVFCNHEIRENMVYADSIKDAARILKDTTGAIFLTCGSKEIEAFAEIRDYPERVFARVLPMQEVMEKCEMLGFKKSNISYMQGPFSKELNLAMLKAAKARFLVTKDSGEAGGFREKIEAAGELGVTVVLIKHPELPSNSASQMESTDAAGQPQSVALRQSTVYNQEQVIQKLVRDYALEWQHKHPWFPLFVSLKNKKIIVFGGGKIAIRRIRSLLQFDADITVIAPEFGQELNRELETNENLTLHRRAYSEGDCFGADLVVAATSDAQANRQIAEECSKYVIPVSVADCKELCTFYFPAVIRRGNMVIGLTASGEDHAKAKRTADKLRLFIDQILD